MAVLPVAGPVLLEAEPRFFSAFSSPSLWGLALSDERFVVAVQYRDSPDDPHSTLHEHRWLLDARGAVLQYARTEPPGLPGGGTLFPGWFRVGPSSFLRIATHFITNTASPPTPSGAYVITHYTVHDTGIGQDWVHYPIGPWVGYGPDSPGSQTQSFLDPATGLLLIVPLTAPDLGALPVWAVDPVDGRVAWIELLPADPWGTRFVRSWQPAPGQLALRYYDFTPGPASAAQQLFTISATGMSALGAPSAPSGPHRYQLSSSGASVNVLDEAPDFGTVNDLILAATGGPDSAAAQITPAVEVDTVTGFGLVSGTVRRSLDSVQVFNAWVVRAVADPTLVAYLPYLRMVQRDDGLGINSAPRLGHRSRSVSNPGYAPRVGRANRYD